MYDTEGFNTKIGSMGRSQNFGFFQHYLIKT